MNQITIQRALNRKRRLLSTHHTGHRHYLLTQIKSPINENGVIEHKIESDNSIQMYAMERFLEYMRRSEICAR